MLPSGTSGKLFVGETTKWIEYWNQNSRDFKNVASKVVMIIPAIRAYSCKNPRLSQQQRNIRSAYQDN